MTYRYLSLFCGLGGLSLGFELAGFTCVGAFDADEEACEDHEYLTGAPASPADLADITPAQLARLCTDRPDVVCTSPPCKSFSGCLPEAKSSTPKYRALSSLAYRGIWLSLEAWDTPPPLLVMENVPRIQTRGAEWLESVIDLLESYGYAVRETTHDCGRIGHLAQSRRRYLLVARHREQTPDYLYVPPKYELRGIGEVIGDLPVPAPDCDRGGPMHRLTRLSALNWARLALIPAGGDWRDIPERVALSCEPRATAYGVEGWGDTAGTVVGSACHDNGGWTVADPRCTTPGGRREGSMGVTDWSEESTTVIGHGRVHNGPWQVADPRIQYEPRDGWMRVQHPGEPANTVIGDYRWVKGSNLADSRPVTATHFVAQTIEGTPAIIGPQLDLDSRQSADPVPVIRAADGTWHRPMTTLELATLQGFPTKIDGEWLHLAGGSKSRWRQRIGNAVPPPAAEAIARECADVLEAAEDGGYRLRGEPVWVERRREVSA